MCTIDVYLLSMLSVHLRDTKLRYGIAFLSEQNTSQSRNEPGLLTNCVLLSCASRQLGLCEKLHLIWNPDYDLLSLRKFRVMCEQNLVCASVMESVPLASSAHVKCELDCLV